MSHVWLSRCMAVWIFVRFVCGVYLFVDLLFLCRIHFFLLGCLLWLYFFFFFSSRRRHTRCLSDWSSDACSSDLIYRLSCGRHYRPFLLVLADLFQVGVGDRLVTVGNLQVAVGL